MIYIIITCLENILILILLKDNFFTGNLGLPTMFDPLFFDVVYLLSYIYWRLLDRLRRTCGLKTVLRTLNTRYNLAQTIHTTANATQDAFLAGVDPSISKTFSLLII